SHLLLSQKLHHLIQKLHQNRIDLAVLSGFLQLSLLPEGKLQILQLLLNPTVLHQSQKSLGEIPDSALSLPDPLSKRPVPLHHLLPAGLAEGGLLLYTFRTPSFAAARVRGFLPGSVPPFPALNPSGQHIIFHPVRRVL